MPDPFSTPNDSNQRGASPQQTVAAETVAASVKTACIEAAMAAYEDAAANGLCAEGAWECAVDAMRRLKVADLLQSASTSAYDSDQTSNR